jgi:hypothetical protein
MEQRLRLVKDSFPRKIKMPDKNITNNKILH